MSPLQETSELGTAVSVAYLAGAAVAAAAATTIVVVSKNLLSSPTHKNGVPLPPGPPATWFWENPMPKKNIAHALGELVTEYGPVVSFRHGSSVKIVIGRMDAATELMEKEGGVLVDRPRMIAAAEIYSGGKRLIFESSGDRFRRLRRAVHTHLQPKAAVMYQEMQAEVAKDVVRDILQDPKNFARHVDRYAAAVILRVTYGKTSPTTNEDPEVVRINQVGVNFQTAFRQGAYLVEFIPWLKYMPWYGRELREFGQYELALFRDQLDRVRNDMATNSAGPSFAKTLLEHVNDHGLSEDEIVYLAGSLFNAGSDSTSSAIKVMVMAAACHPDAQARVQEELDEVIGRDRVPTFEDLDMLPHLQAFVLEAKRWRPVVPLGVAHRAMKDIIWRGQCIPAGATVIGCHWAISRDPEVFPDPETFSPGRWLTEDGRVRTDMHFYTFGFGRRVCPGQHVANRSLYINLALLLWSFRILQRPDAPIDTHASKLQDSIAFHPKPFQVDFVPRVEEWRLKELMG